MTRIKVGKYNVSISHESKVLFPESKITKKQLIDYYIRIAPYMLPHIKDRPVAMQRFPEGIGNEGFYHKNVPNYFPRFIQRFPIARSDGGIVQYIMVNTQATLAYLVNYNCITLHAWLSRVDRITHPDRIIFDLDPSGHNFDDVRIVALYLREEIMSHNLSPYVMSTGNRGLHVITPIIRTYPFDAVRAFALKIATTLQRNHKQLCTLEIHKEKREGKVFIDILRNAFGQTSVAPYAVRATPHASIACPLQWSDVEDPNLYSSRYTIANIWDRLDYYGDAWGLINTHKKRLRLM